jgi:vacuolar-type H+-ATPase subunit I/STV1
VLKSADASFSPFQQLHRWRHPNFLLLPRQAFSVPLGIFNSTWHQTDGGQPKWDGSVYPFGVDPIWHKATNKMTFFNSFKMKVIHPGRLAAWHVEPYACLASTYSRSLTLPRRRSQVSIVFGVCQMTVGICLSFFNHRHHGSSVRRWAC